MGGRDGRCGVEEFVVHVVGDERSREFAEVLLEGAGDGVDIKVRVRDVIVIGAFKAFFDLLDLAVAAGFAVDTFHLHTYNMLVSVSILQKEFIKRARWDQFAEDVPLTSTSWMHRITILGTSDAS